MVSKSSYLLIAIGAALAVAFALLVLAAPPASANNDPPGTGGTVTGDWTVTDSRSYSTVSITIQGGNLSIKSGGSLTLTNVLLRFDNPIDGKYSLAVEAGGAMVAGAKTNVSSINTNHYQFVVKGTLTMNNSLVTETWGDTASWTGGIQLYSDSASITNSSIFQGKTGGLSIFNCSPVIDKNIIRNNGMDGKSEVYAFGIYMYNCKSNISNNQIYENTFWQPDYYSVTYYSYPYPGEYYSHYYNGNYYYGYPGYWYRYDYQYIYSRSRYYGSGAVIYNSAITFYNNNVYSNGVGKVAPQYGYDYSQVYEGYGYGTSSYYYYDGWGDHYSWSYKWYYIGNKDYGRGVFCENSTLSFNANTLNENGFRSTHDYYPSDPYVCWHSGVALTMINCQGTITNSTIQNSVILVNLTSSPVRIEGNKIIGDYVGTAQSYYSAQFIPWGTAWGIKTDRCWPDIINNTITIKFKDYPYYVSGGNKYFADLIVLLDLPSAKNTLIKGNKLTFDSQLYGQIACIGVNLSLKATGIVMKDNTVEYKYTPAFSGGGTPISVRLVAMSLKSTVYIDNCTLKGPGSGTAGAPIISGVQGNYGSEAAIYNSTIINCDYGATITDYGILTMADTKITGVIRSGLDIEQLSKATLNRCTISGNGRGIMSIKSVVNIYDSTMSDGTEFYIDKAASINVFNTPHVKNAVIILDAPSYLNVSWPVAMTITWQNGIPVENALLEILTIAGVPVFSDYTIADGTLGGSIWVKEYMAHSNVVTKFTPHRVVASKGRASSMELMMIDKPIDITFQLVDSIPPNLVVKYPFDGQLLNTSLVTFRGSAEDPEAGLTNDGTIEINIDNLGWAPVQVSSLDGSWSYAKPLGDGLHVVRVKAEDLVGNIARTALSVSVDTSAPALNVFSPTEGCYTNQRTITVTGITEESAFVTVNGINVPMQKRYFSTQISLEDGPNTISVVASDGSGNARIVLIHLTLDTQPPLLDIKSPKPGDYTNQDPISIIGSSEPTAIVKVNGVRAQLVNSSFEALVGMSEGANTVTISAVDLAGNINTRTFTVYLDTAAPDLTVFTPRDGLWTNLSKVLVTGATEQGATITINGQNTNVISTVFSGYVTLIEGPNRVDIVAKDLAGNLRTETRTVLLDTRMPDLVVTAPSDRLVSSTSVIPVLGSVDWGAEVRVNGEMFQVTDFVFSTTIAFPEDGTHVIEISARDQAGNTAIITRTVSVDTRIPAITMSYPLEGMKVKQRMITVSGQTEPFATVIVNTETMLVVGRDGLFSVPVLLEDGENRITVQSTDAAGNSQTAAINVIKPKAAEVVKQDLSWALNLTGLLLGIGIALPIATWLLTDSWSRRRYKVLAEIETAQGERQAREAEAARMATLPRVEKMGRKKPRTPEPPPEPKAEPPAMKPAPAAEAAAPEVAKTGLKDKSGATEVSPDETDQTTKMDAKSAPADEKKPETPQSDAGLKDKGEEAEGEAGETELAGGQGRKK